MGKIMQVSIFLICAIIYECRAFIGKSTRGRAQTSFVAASDGPVSLVDADPGAVQKEIFKAGTSQVSKGDEVELEYKGTISGQGEDWTPNETVNFWLSSQQGLEHLSEGFIEKSIDGREIVDETSFNEEFVTSELGVSNKIQAKKLCMAAKRLRNQREDFSAGTKFDSGVMSVVVGAGKTIKGMELAIESMKIGESAKVTIRTDYAYGSEGFRKRNGDVLVPPYASLCFEINIKEAK